MKITKIAMLILVIAVALYVLFPNLSWAEEEVASSGVQSDPSVPDDPAGGEQAMMMPTKGNTNSGERMNPLKATRMYTRITNLLKPLFPLAFTVGLALAASPVFAQSASPNPLPATISGTAVGPTDEAIPGATVVLQGPGSRDRYSTSANDNGFFEFQDVKSGIPYQVLIHADGFADWTSPAVVLDPGQYKILTGCKLRLPDVETTINVGYSSVEMATQQVKAAEQQRVLGIVPNFYAVYDRNPEPLTVKLKFQLALRTAVDPVTIFGIATIAGLDQAGNTPDYQQGAKGYGQRFGAVAAGGFSDILIGGAVLPALLHQDPRYFYQGSGTTKSRLLHALSQPFICKGDDGRGSRTTPAWVAT